MNVVFYIVRCILNVVKFILYPFLFYVPKSSRKSVPPVRDDLLTISATKLAEMIREKKISSEEIVHAYIKRIKEVDPLIKAVVEDRFKDAIKEAKFVDAYLRTSPLPNDELQKMKPLLGVPITIKESCMLSGMSLSVGSALRKGIKAEADGEAVGRIKRSGAIPLLVSSTPELCASLQCQSRLLGNTCCPYDITRNSGGSSGGEAALIGAGASLLGIGSDLGGSIRFPSMCCGIFGHKPSPRTIPLKGHYPLPEDKRIYDYLKLGPMARYAEDLRTLLVVLCGKQANELKLHEKVDLKNMRVYCMEEISPSLIFPSVDENLRESIREAAIHLKDKCDAKIIGNHNFEEIFLNSFDMSVGLLTSLGGLPKIIPEERSSLVEIIKVLRGKSDLSLGFLQTRLLLANNKLFLRKNHEQIRKNIRKEMTELLRDDAVLICPTFPSGSLKHGEIIFLLGELIYLIPLNVLGLPATNVPCGMTSDGLPIGLQVIAGPNQDRLCLAVAEELEKCFGGWINPTKHQAALGIN